VFYFGFFLLCFFFFKVIIILKIKRKMTKAKEKHVFSTRGEHLSSSILGI